MSSPSVQTAAVAAFRWPTPPGSANVPRWTGRGFDLGDSVHGVLRFIGQNSGWSDELTEFQEAESNAGDHPMDRASRKHAIDALTRRLSSPNAVVLEVGCSSGYFLRDVRKALPNAFVIGADYVRGPLDKLAETTSGVPLLEFDLTACPLDDACVDAVVALNVLEHIQDDAAAIRQIHRILKPGAVAVIELPAGPHLYDVYDKMLMHYRRYSLRDATEAFRAAGFRIEHPSHLGFFLYPAFAIVKHRNKRHLRESEERQRAMVAKTIRDTNRSPLLQMAMSLEANIGRFMRYPVGIRCVFEAIKV